MRVPCTIRIDYTLAAPGGAVQAVVNYLGADGTVCHSEEPTPIGPGKSLTVGPVDVEAQITARAELGDTPKHAKPASAKPAKPAA